MTTDWIGRPVLVRTYSAGVHIGTLRSRAGREVVLTEAHIVWRWHGANTLHELARYGASMDSYTRISEAVPEILLTEAIEIIPLEPAAAGNLMTPRWL